jgi:cell wall-associated NlpC family hydrolase
VDVSPLPADRYRYLAGLIGTPYCPGAEGPEAFDCYHLVAHVLANLEGYRLPRLQAEPATTREAAEAMLAHPERANWQEVASPQDLDLVLMGNVLKRDFHLGIYVLIGSSGSVLHCDRDRGVVRASVSILRQTGYNYLRFFRRA